MKADICISILVGLAVFLTNGLCSADSPDTSQIPLKAGELSLEEDLRDPFWPPGYEPREEDAGLPVPSGVTPQPRPGPRSKKIEWPEIKVSAIVSRADKNMAVIEGVGVVEPGQILRLLKDGMVYRLQIESITKNGVSVKRIDVKSQE
ncbi:MAG: hypothetical protein R6V03_08730 [Kiritimatiellia bacterium]